MRSSFVALALLVALVAVLQAACAFQFLETVEASITLGDSVVNVTSVKKLNDNGTPTSDLAFLNLHENENTSVVAAKMVVYWYGGSLYFLQHGGERLITFKLDNNNNVSYTFDPNRMFTPTGRKKSLEQYSSYSPEADAAISKLATQVLQIYAFNSRKIVVAIHNNGPFYSAEDYLPGHPFAAEAKAVTLEPGTNPHNFFFVTRTSEYDTLRKQGLNVVLQADPVNGTLDDDGSLSVYASMANKPYVNVEARAEWSGEGIMMVQQMIMFDKMARQLFPHPIWTEIDWRIGGPLLGMVVVTVISLITAVFFCRRSNQSDYEMMQ